MRCNKKAQMLGYLVGFGFLTALVYFYVLTLNAHPVGIEGFAGELPLYTISAEQFSDNMLLYVHEAAGIAEEQALIQLGNESGTNCGDYLGYDLWDDDCSRLQSSYEAIFNQNMNSILEQYPQNKLRLSERFALLPGMNSGYYKLFLNTNEIVGTRDVPAVIEMFYGDNLAVPTARYEFIPSFSIATQYDYNIFNVINNNMRALVLPQQPGENPLSGLDASVGGCAPNTPIGIFYDVAEKIEWCMQTEEPVVNCKCDISQADLQLLGTQYIIVLEDGKAHLKEKIKGEIVATHEFEGGATIAYQKPDEEFSFQSLKKLTEAKLEWHDTNILTISDTDYGGQFSKTGALFRYKNSANDILAIISDEQRSSTYEQFSTCSPPTLDKFRMCIDGGEINHKPIKFKLALDLTDGLN